MKCFSTIVESSRRCSKPRGVRFPFDSSKKIATTEIFPIEETGDAEVKIFGGLPMAGRWSWR